MALARALERCEVSNAGFRHASHLRVALVYLKESASVDDAIDRMAATLRRFAASVGHPEKYSQPTTEFWRMVSFQTFSCQSLIFIIGADRGRGGRLHSG